MRNIQQSSRTSSMPWVGLCLIYLCSACTFQVGPEPLPPVQTPYTFMVAGHAYGKPGAPYEQGIHPPLQEALPLIEEEAAPDFAMLTGDVVQFSAPDTWAAFWQSWTDWEAPVYIAPGNHDLKNRELYEEQVGETYFAFMHNEDLHIVLEPYGTDWNIEGEQLDFFFETLDSLAPQAQHVFIYTHQAIWWERDNRYGRHLILNSTEGRADRLNFWPVIFPRLLRLDQPVYLFTGDVGAIWGNKRLAVFYAEDGGIHFIGSGMGNNRTDNVLIVKVSDTGEVDFDLWALQGNDPDAMGELMDHTLPE